MLDDGSRKLWLLACILVLTLACRPAAAARKWVVLTDCELLADPSNDGDSFHVRHKRRHYVFRLYFVDTPEVDLAFPERVKEQAAYWGITERQALALGAQARQFTRERLGRPFTVYTKYEDARGRSDRGRFFAVVKVGDEYLSDALVKHGLARVYGAATDLPDGTPAARYWARLRTLERQAKAARLGGWGLARPSGHALLGRSITNAPATWRLVPPAAGSGARSQGNSTPVR